MQLATGGDVIFHQVNEDVILFSNDLTTFQSVNPEKNNKNNKKCNNNFDGFNSGSH